MSSEHSRSPLWQRLKQRVRRTVRTMRLLLRGELDMLIERSQSLESRIGRVNADLRDAIDAHAQASHQADQAIEAKLARHAEQARQTDQAITQLEATLTRQVDEFSQAVMQMESRLTERLATLENARLADRIDELEKLKLADRIIELEKAKLVSRVETLEKAKLAARLDKLEQAKLTSRLDKLDKAKLTSRMSALEKVRTKFEAGLARHAEQAKEIRGRLDTEVKQLQQGGKQMKSDLEAQLAAQANELKHDMKGRLGGQADQFKQLKEQFEARLTRQADQFKQVKERLEQRLARQEERAKDLKSKLETKLDRQTGQLKDVKGRLDTLLAAGDGVLEFDHVWSHLAHYVDTQDPALEDRIHEAREGVRDFETACNRLLDVLCEDDVIHFQDASLRFIDRKALWTVIREILIDEEYFFSHPNSSPRIIDGGSNFGLSIYYFKHLYPDARILGFEPADDLFEMVTENVKRNQWRDVEVLPYALGEIDGPQTFYHTEQDRLAGSLTRRKQRFGNKLIEDKVECRRLSQFLDEPVDLLKLDIEGAERKVLPEIQACLPRVRHLVCEYHVDPAMQPEHLGRTIDLLERSNFYVHLSKSDSFGRSTLRRPMDAVNRPVSLVIWAKNRRPVPEPDAVSMGSGTPNGR